MFWFELPYSIPPPPKDKSKANSLGFPGPKAPMLSRSPTMPTSVTVPTLKPIEESTTTSTMEGHGRPEMVPTESTLPLLPEAHGRRRRSSDSESLRSCYMIMTLMVTVVNESMVSSTFPPIESSPEDEFPPVRFFDGVDIENDPFRGGSSDRQSSESSDPPPSSTLQLPSVSAAAIREKEILSRPPPSPDLPLCTLVVDDDK